MQLYVRAGSVLALFMFFGVVACRSGTQPGCDVCTTSAIVYGQVRTASGAAVSGVSVHVEGHRAACDGLGAAEETVLTRSDGSYRAQPRSPESPFQGCFSLTVFLNGTSGSPAASATSALVQFRADYPAGIPHDSTRVDVTLGS